MASGIFAVLDDIAALMDDVGVASKIATKKTAGILGDDLAVNAEKATGFLSSREIPVLWAITKGSLLNKLIIVPIVLLLNYYLPETIKWALILGGFYLAYEGVEKIIEFLFHRHKKGEEVIEELKDDQNAEKKKIRAAITTDFILSLEIVIIALNSVLEKELTTQILTVSIVAFFATIGVYGIVALIVRMDDAGFKIIRHSHGSGFLIAIVRFLVRALPVVIKILGVVGTIALLLVSGEIFNHKLEFVHHLLPNLNQTLKALLCGLVGGLIALPAFTVLHRIKEKFSKKEVAP